MLVKIAINGFGRIGRCATRIIFQRDDCELVAINDTANRDMTKYLLQFDSVHGKFKKNIKILNDDFISIDNKQIRVFSNRLINDFSEFGAEVLLECTGSNLTKEKCEPFIKNSLKKVIMSAPAKDDSPTFVFGVNDGDYKGQSIISNASCTTNCLAPLVKVLDDNFGINKALMSTIHAYTNGQSILDSKSKDERRSRAGAENLLPTSTGAAKAIGKVLPHLNGKIHGLSVRVPVPNVSMVDLTAVLAKKTNKDEINEIFKKASENEMKNLIAIDDEKMVSRDIVGNSASAIFINDTTQVIGEDMVKILAWYDNEWGYSSRLIDMAIKIAKA